MLQSSDIHGGNAVGQHAGFRKEKGVMPLKNEDRTQGIIFIIMAGLFFAMMTLFVRLSGDLPTMQKAFFRNLVAAVAAVILLGRTEEKFYIRKSSWPLLLARSICGTAGLICNFYAIDKIGLADANMLNKLSPFFAIIASYFILGETADRVEWGFVGVAFAGALFIIRPSFNVASLYGLCGAAGGLGAGIAYSMVRKLGKMGERGPVIVMVFSVFSSLVTLPFMIASYRPMTFGQLACLLAAGAMAAGGQLSITKAYTKAPAKEISVFDYTQILFSAILGILFLGELPDLFSVIGYIVIIGVAVLKWRYHLREK